MQHIFSITLKGVFRDRIFQGIMMVALVFLALPSISTLSMRQVTELSITLSLSLISFILLLLSVFLGGTSLWKDIERRYTFSVLGLPVTRGQYLLGKFAAIAGFIVITTAFLGLISTAVVFYASGVYPPDRPIVWSNFALALVFDALKYMLLVGFAFLFSTVSTSFFLPIFGAICVFLIGNATQQVYDFLQTPEGHKLPAFVQGCAQGLYYVVPNFSAFDLKLNAIYGIAPSPSGLGLTVGYFVVYLAIVLTLSCLIFARRELR